MHAHTHKKTHASTHDVQEPAMELARTWPSLRIFAEEINDHGGRVFWVSSLEGFFGSFGDGRRRHVYEMISEDDACRMYFDVEFKIAGDEDPAEAWCRGNAVVDDLVVALQVP
jgi:hypothetical protein